MGILKNVLIGLDQTVNCLFRMGGRYGVPDETLSARAWRMRNDGYPRLYIWIDRLFFWERRDGKRHCELAYESEMSRAHMPEEYQ